MAATKPAFSASEKKSYTQRRLEYFIWEVFEEVFPGSLGATTDRHVQLEEELGRETMKRVLEEQRLLPAGPSYWKYTLDEVYVMQDVSAFAYCNVKAAVNEIQKTGGIWFLPESMFDPKTQQHSVRTCVGLAIFCESINRFFNENLVETHLQGDFIFPRPDKPVPIEERTLADSIYLEFEVFHILH